MRHFIKLIGMLLRLVQYTQRPTYELLEKRTQKFERGIQFNSFLGGGGKAYITQE